MGIGLPIFFILVVLYALFAARLDRMSITMPMIFVVFGALLGPHGFGFLQSTAEWLTVERFVELTLVLLLFADAATLNFHQVSEDRMLPARLLSWLLQMQLLVGQFSPTRRCLYVFDGH